MRPSDLRATVPDWIDALLCEWSRWMKSGTAADELGWRKHSAGFSSSQSLHSFEDLTDQVDGWRVQVADSIIDGLELPQKIAINHVYFAAVWSSHRWTIEDKFAEAVADFGEEGRRRGLV